MENTPKDETQAKAKDINKIKLVLGIPGFYWFMLCVGMLFIVTTMYLQTPRIELDIRTVDGTTFITDRVTVDSYRVIYPAIAKWSAAQDIPYDKILLGTYDKEKDQIDTQPAAEIFRSLEKSAKNPVAFLINAGDVEDVRVELIDIAGGIEISKSKKYFLLGSQNGVEYEMKGGGFKFQVVNKFDGTVDTSFRRTYMSL